MTARADLQPVRRVYFRGVEDPVPEPQQEIELWCSGCRHTYPNAPKDIEMPGDAVELS